ncbi:MAG: hypothetical protein WAT71_07235 [Ignavibacteria bacterium]
MSKGKNQHVSQNKEEWDDWCGNNKGIIRLKDTNDAVRTVFKKVMSIAKKPKSDLTFKNKQRKIIRHELFYIR